MTLNYVRCAPLMFCAAISFAASLPAVQPSTPLTAVVLPDGAILQSGGPRNGSRGGSHPETIGRFAALAGWDASSSGQRTSGSGETGGQLRHGRIAGSSGAWSARLVARSERHYSPLQRSGLRQHSRRCGSRYVRRERRCAETFYWAAPWAGCWHTSCIILSRILPSMAAKASRKRR